MLDNKTKDRIHEESQQFAKENYSHKCPVAYYYSRGAESEATRAQPLVELLEYLERWFNENPLSGRIHKALTKYNNPK